MSFTVENYEEALATEAHRVLLDKHHTRGKHARDRLWAILNGMLNGYRLLLDYRDTLEHGATEGHDYAQACQPIADIIRRRWPQDSRDIAEVAAFVNIYATPKEEAPAT